MDCHSVLQFEIEEKTWLGRFFIRPYLFTSLGSVQKKGWKFRCQEEKSGFEERTNDIGVWGKEGTSLHGLGQSGPDISLQKSLIISLRHLPEPESGSGIPAPWIRGRSFRIGCSGEGVGERKKETGIVRRRKRLVQDISRTARENWLVALWRICDVTPNGCLGIPIRFNPVRSWHTRTKLLTVMDSWSWRWRSS